MRRLDEPLERWGTIASDCLIAYGMANSMELAQLTCGFKSDDPEEDRKRIERLIYLTQESQHRLFIILNRTLHRLAQEEAREGSQD